MNHKITKTPTQIKSVYPEFQNIKNETIMISILSRLVQENMLNTKYEISSKFKPILKFELKQRYSQFEKQLKNMSVLEVSAFDSNVVEKLDDIVDDIKSKTQSYETKINNLMVCYYVKLGCSNANFMARAATAIFKTLGIRTCAIILQEQIDSYDIRKFVIDIEQLFLNFKNIVEKVECTLEYKSQPDFKFNFGKATFEVPDENGILLSKLLNNYVFDVIEYINSNVFGV